MDLNADNFDQEVLQADGVVLTDWWAPWCGPCNAMTPLVSKLSQQHKVGKINIDENQDLARKYQISAIPAFLFFKDGEVVHRLVGIQTEAVITNMMEALQT